MIGAYTPVSTRLHVAAGYSKWGLTGGAMAAMVLTDRLTGGVTTDVFSPHRISPRGLPTLARIGAKVRREPIGDRFAPGEVGTVAEVPRGAARVLRRGLDRVGVFRDDDDELHAVSVRCIHLGCIVRSNGAENSWDCPCHGSRFDVGGAGGAGGHPADPPQPARGWCVVVMFVSPPRSTRPQNDTAVLADVLHRGTMPPARPRRRHHRPGARPARPGPGRPGGVVRELTGSAPRS